MSFVRSFRPGLVVLCACLLTASSAHTQAPSRPTWLEPYTQNASRLIQAATADDFAWRRLAELTGARVETRFARLFLKLCDQIGKPDRGGTFVPMPLTRQELADLTGTTIETTIRIMSRWQKEDVLHTEKDGFVVLDRAVLDETAAG